MTICKHLKIDNTLNNTYYNRQTTRAYSQERILQTSSILLQRKHWKLSIKHSLILLGTKQMRMHTNTHATQTQIILMETYTQCKPQNNKNTSNSTSNELRECWPAVDQCVHTHASICLQQYATSQVSICKHTRMHAHAHAHKHTHTHACMHEPWYMHAYLQADMHTRMHAHRRAHHTKTWK